VSSWQAEGAAEIQLCPGTATLQISTRLRALRAGMELRVSQRELKVSWEWEDAESSLLEKTSQPLSQVL